MDELPDDTELLMHCMLLAFQYYPVLQQPQQSTVQHSKSSATTTTTPSPTTSTPLVGSATLLVNVTASLLQLLNSGDDANSTSTATTLAADAATASTPRPSLLTSSPAAAASAFTDYPTAVLLSTMHPSFARAANARDFIADCARASPHRPYDLAWEAKALWAVLFGAMLLVAIVGNCIVIWIVLAHREMRTITNYFLLNLSVADLLMSSLNGVFNFVSMLNANWPFGALYCSVNNFIAYVTVATSVFTLVAISFDRYVAIVRPLHRRNSRRKARLCLSVIWLLSAVLSLPGLMYSATEAKRYRSGRTRTVCYLLWPDGRYPFSATDYTYNIVFLVLTYGVPMLVMCVCYTVMGRELWGSQSIGEHTERQRESVRAKKKVVRMFVAVVVIFGICWLPYHAWYVYAYHNPRVAAAPAAPHVYLAFYWLAMANSMVNPIIYYWMNRKFRHYFQEAMCCGGLWRMATEMGGRVKSQPGDVYVMQQLRPSLGRGPQQQHQQHQQLCQSQAAAGAGDRLDSMQSVKSCNNQMADSVKQMTELTAQSPKT